MDSRRFDEVARALAGSTSRRGFGGLLAALAAGGAVAGAEARRRCRRDSPPGQCCRKRGGVVACTCDDGGAVCGAECCRIGQECRDGRCVEMPEPGQCIPFGEACKNLGRPCCAGMVCGSGQGGQGDVACYLPAGGACGATADCVFGAECRMGRCVAVVPPTPVTCPEGAACVDASLTCSIPELAENVATTCQGGRCACSCVADGGNWIGAQCRSNADCIKIDSGYECYSMFTGAVGCTESTPFCCCNVSG